MNKEKCGVVNCVNLGKIAWGDYGMKLCQSHYDKYTRREQETSQDD